MQALGCRGHGAETTARAEIRRRERGGKGDGRQSAGRDVVVPV